MPTDPEALNVKLSMVSVLVVAPVMMLPPDDVKEAFDPLAWIEANSISPTELTVIDPWSAPMNLISIWRSAVTSWK